MAKPLVVLLWECCSGGASPSYMASTSMRIRFIMSTTTGAVMRIRRSTIMSIRRSIIANIIRRTIVSVRTRTSTVMSMSKRVSLTK
jgi:hypothetical protein